MMLENTSAGAEGLLVRAEPLEWAEEVSQRMVYVERTEDGVLASQRRSRMGQVDLLSVGLEGVRVNELRKETTTAARLMT